MYSIVTPLEAFIQEYAVDEAPIIVEPGRSCVVVGVAKEQPDFIWAEIDDPGPFLNAHICINAAHVAYIGEVGEPKHLNGPR